MKNNGFTLIELLVVIAVLGVFLAMAIPSYNTTINQHRVKAVASRLYGDVYFTKVEAIKRNTPMYLTFTGDSSTTATGWTVNDGTNQIRDFNLADYRNVGMTIANKTIQFDPIRGVIDITQNITVRSPYGCLSVSLTPLGYAEVGDFFTC